MRGVGHMLDMIARFKMDSGQPYSLEVFDAASNGWIGTPARRVVCTLGADAALATAHQLVSATAAGLTLTLPPVAGAVGLDVVVASPLYTLHVIAAEGSAHGEWTTTSALLVSDGTDWHAVVAA